MIAFPALAGTFAHCWDDATDRPELRTVVGWLVAADGKMEPLLINDSGDDPRMGTPAALGLRVQDVEGPTAIEVELIEEQSRGKYV